MVEEPTHLSPGGDTAPSTDERTPAEIRRHIQRTRADLDATVDALGRQLRPGHLLWQARHRLEPRARRAIARAAGRHRTALLTGAGALLAAVALGRLARRRRRRASGFPPEQQGV
jgi:hypothetical protein